MKITLKTIGVLEEVIKTREFYFMEDKIRLGSLFRYLADCYGPVVTEHLLPEGKFSSHYAVLVNGTNSKQINDMETELKDGDRITILTMVTGG